MFVVTAGTWIWCVWIAIWLCFDLELIALWWTCYFCLFCVWCLDLRKSAFWEFWGFGVDFCGWLVSLGLCFVFCFGCCCLSGGFVDLVLAV